MRTIRNVVLAHGSRLNLDGIGFRLMASVSGAAAPATNPMVVALIEQFETVGRMRSDPLYARVGDSYFFANNCSELFFSFPDNTSDTGTVDIDVFEHPSERIEAAPQKPASATDTIVASYTNQMVVGYPTWVDPYFDIPIPAGAKNVVGQMKSLLSGKFLYGRMAMVNAAGTEVADSGQGAVGIGTQYSTAIATNSTGTVPFFALGFRTGTSFAYINNAAREAYWRDDGPLVANGRIKLSGRGFAAADVFNPGDLTLVVRFGLA